MGRTFRKHDPSHAAHDAGGFVVPGQAPRPMPSNSEQQDLLQQVAPEDELFGSLLQEELGTSDKGYQEVTTGPSYTPEQSLSGSLLQEELGTSDKGYQEVTTGPSYTPEQVLSGAQLFEGVDESGYKAPGAPSYKPPVFDDSEYDFVPGMFQGVENRIEMERIEGSKLSQQGKEQRRTVALNRMLRDGTVRPGEVNDTYQSKYDKGKNFGAENELLGIWGSDYVLHGHYYGGGGVKPQSLGLKLGSNPYGPRLNTHSGIDDGLAPPPKQLVQGRKQTLSKKKQPKKKTTPQKGW